MYKAKLSPTIFRFAQEFQGQRTGGETTNNLTLYNKDARHMRELADNEEVMPKMTKICDYNNLLLFNDDCRKMSDLADNSIHVICTSPPY